MEVLIRSDYIKFMHSIIKNGKKSIHLILNKKISDHWKENIIPIYSWRMIKSSIYLLLIFGFIILIFLVTDNLLKNFFTFSFSLNGVTESILFVFSYAYLRRFILK